MDLNELRTEIDGIDTELVQLFTRRMRVCGDIAGYKAENGLPVMNPGRERQILSRVSELAGDELDSYTRGLFSSIFDLSRTYQAICSGGDSPLDGAIRTALEKAPDMFPKKAVVACQGVEGAYSQQACDQLFSFADITFFKSFDGVFSAVENGLCQYGVLPIENSSHGSVNSVYDLMRNHDFHIVRGTKLHIRHCLLAAKGAKLENIREMVSHEQAVGQCGKFLATVPGVKVTVCENTAMAAKMVAESGRTDIAAISSETCAPMYGLSVLREGVQDTDNNYTRFIVISKKLEIFPGADRISMMFAVPNTPGSLTRALSKFSALGLNMTKLESRPVPGTDFHYMFYMDVEASACSAQVRKLLGELERELEMFVFLGCYSEV